MATQAPTLGYYLGCPGWASAGRSGELYSRSASKDDRMREYSTVFNTVEGNTTYHAIPTVEKVRRLANEAVPGFRFALKFPKAISHERQLLNADVETALFLELLDILARADRLGPSFLQLSPTFSSRKFGALRTYLRKLPKEFPYAVEVRHEDFFDKGRNEQALDSLLGDLGIDKVILDTTPLFSAPPNDEYEEGAQQNKPRVPLRRSVTGTRPMVRIIGRDQAELVQPYFDDWAPIVAEWITAGLTPYVFAHAPDDVRAAELARRFHLTLMKHLPSVAPLPAFHGEAESASKPRQQELF